MLNSVGHREHYQSLSQENAITHIDNVNKRILSKIDDLVPNNFEGLYNNLPRNSLKEAIKTNFSLSEQLNRLDPETPFETVSVSVTDQNAKPVTYFDIRNSD